MKHLITLSLFTLLSNDGAVASLTFKNVENGSVESIEMYREEMPAQTYYPITGTIKALALGAVHTCIIEDSAVRCWGMSSNYEIKLPTKFIHPKSLVSGNDHLCALDEQGVQCWGSNEFQQTNVPKNIKNTRRLVSGKNHNCVIDEEGVKCWGDNSNGQSTVPPNLKNPKEIALNDTQTCVIDDEGLKCWGIGRPNKHNIFKNPTMIFGGSETFCVLTGSVSHSEFECWNNSLKDRYNPIGGLASHGYSFGMLRGEKIISMGLGSYRDLNSFDNCYLVNNDSSKRVSCVNSYKFIEDKFINLKNPTILSTYNERSCLVDDNRIICWGNGAYGQIPPPTSLINPKEFASGKGHTCSIDDEGIKCWGSNLEGQLQALNKVNNPTEISAGPNRTCAIGNIIYSNNPTGLPGVICWGKTDIIGPIAGIKNPTSISVSEDYSCLIDGQKVKCWGKNYKYDVFYGETYGPMVIPLQFKNPRLVVADKKRACALDDLGMKCWGETSSEVTFDQSKYFYREKNIPLKLAQDILENIEVTRETKSSLFYLREVITDLFLIGTQSDISTIISDNTKNIKKLYRNKKLVSEKTLALRNSTQLRFLLDIVVSSLDSSKYLLSSNSKVNIDKLKLEFTAALSENIISLQVAEDLINMVLSDEVMMKEMGSSHRLVGIRKFYEWVHEYIQKGTID